MIIIAYYTAKKQAESSIIYDLWFLPENFRSMHAGHCPLGCIGNADTRLSFQTHSRVTKQMRMYMRQTVLLCEILQGIPYRVRVDACSIPMLGKAHDTFYGLLFPQKQKYTDTADLPVFSWVECPLFS